jgi:hypothetical protein
MSRKNFATKKIFMIKKNFVTMKIFLKNCNQKELYNQEENSNNKNIVIKKKMIVTNKNFRIKKNTNTKSCYRINSLSMKHVDAPKSISVWVCTIMDLSLLIMVGNKKQGVVSLLFWPLDSGRSCGACYMLTCFFGQAPSMWFSSS